MSRRSESQERLARWTEYRVHNGLKETDARRAVAELFLETDGHLTLDEVVTLVRKRSPRIGQATVHRTLKLLEEAGLVERHIFEGRLSRYEAVRDRAHHDHMICTVCGGITEFASPEIEELQERIARALGFIVRMHRHELYGTCAHCLSIRREAERKNPPLDG